MAVTVCSIDSIVAANIVTLFNNGIALGSVGGGGVKLLSVQADMRIKKENMIDTNNCFFKKSPSSRIHNYTKNRIKKTTPFSAQDWTRICEFETTIFTAPIDVHCKLLNRI